MPERGILDNAMGKSRLSSEGFDFILLNPLKFLVLSVPNPASHLDRRRLDTKGSMIKFFMKFDNDSYELIHSTVY
jgi:hypothetical protein